MRQLDSQRSHEADACTGAILGDFTDPDNISGRLLGLNDQSITSQVRLFLLDGIRVAKRARGVLATALERHPIRRLRNRRRPYAATLAVVPHAVPLAARHPFNQSSRRATNGASVLVLPASTHRHTFLVNPDQSNARSMSSR